MKCRPGDMAVVLSAVHKSNVGKFVSVLKLYDAHDVVDLGCGQPVWLVHSHSPLTWRTGKKLWFGTQGPVPDAALQPIRGPSTARFHSTLTSVKNDRVKHSD